MDASATSVPAANAWQPMHLHLVAFPVTLACDIEQDWWQDLTGQRPEESIRKPQERLDRGGFQEFALALSADLHRLTWTMSPRVSSSTLAENPTPTLGPFGDVSTQFLQLMRQWLGRPLPQMKRIAFAGRLIQRVADNASGMQRLARYLPDVRLDLESTDFL